MRSLRDHRVDEPSVSRSPRRSNASDGIDGEIAINIPDELDENGNPSASRTTVVCQGLFESVVSIELLVAIASFHVVCTVPGTVLSKGRYVELSEDIAHRHTGRNASVSSMAYSRTCHGLGSKTQYERHPNLSE